MALVIRGKTTCSICGQVQRDGADLVATTHFIRDDAHPLWRYSDSAMHRACFLNWPQANAFRAAFNETCSKADAKHFREMLEDGTIVGRAGSRS